MSAEKTEEPTPKRLADARRRGDVARSRALVSFAALASFYVVALGAAPALVSGARASILAAMQRIEHPFAVPGAAVLWVEAIAAAGWLAPILLAMLVVGGAVAFLDAGPVFALAKIAPEPERLDPVKGAAQLFSRERFVELAKSVVVLIALGAIAFSTLHDAIPWLARLVSHRPERALAVLGLLLSRLFLRALVLLAGVATVDVVLSRRQHLRGLRMSKDEVRREQKEAEGDPHQKGERARMHREILEHSVLEGVRRADVLVVNPTHLAIALRFDEASEQEAPEIVAKGEDELARRMIEAAREAGVPVMRDVPLARSLYELELGGEVPEVLYEAVAAVLRAAWAEREEGP